MSYLSPYSAYFPNFYKNKNEPPRRFSSPNKRSGSKTVNARRSSLTKDMTSGNVSDADNNKASKSSFIRVNVFVRKNTDLHFEKADFSICLFDYFGIDEDRGLISCHLENNKVYLQPIPRLSTPNNSPQKHWWKQMYRFEHPAFCATHQMTDVERTGLPQEIAQRGVDVGVAIILESSDGKILVTRRAYHMRSFPGIWVPPGGHIEEGETFEQAGLREVKEETGLELDQDVQCRQLGLWESVYPAVLYEGQPKRHHLVVYLTVVVNQSSEEIQKLIKLDPVEVGAYMWINEDLISIVVEGGIPRRQIKMMQIPIMVGNTDGGYTRDLLDPKVLSKKMPAPRGIVERLSTGTRYALRLWLQQKRQSEGIQS